MISVGIHENLVINKAEVTTEQNGKALNISFKQANSGPKVDALTAMLGGTGVGSGVSNEQNFKLFSFSATKQDGTVKEGADLIKVVDNRRKQLNHILLQYMTEDKVDWKPEVVAKKLALKSLEDFEAKIVVQANLDFVFDVMAEQFIAMMKPFVGEDGKKLYVKFNRSSQTSNFPKLPERFLESQPFLAPMSDDAAKQKVKYSAWDIANKVNSAERNLADVDATPEELQKQKDAVDNVFGS